MKLSQPTTRATLVWAVWMLLLTWICWSWVFMRFLHDDSQYRSLAPEYYDVQVVTADDYRLLADPANREVKLSDGSTVIKAEPWDRIVLPNYKETRDGQHYVLVTTKGTAHALGYVEHYFFLFGFIALCGAVASTWNTMLVSREASSTPSETLPEST
jgi:hypothetical protein